MFLREPADNRCGAVCHVGGGILDLSFVMGNCSGDSTAPTRACRWSFTTRSGAPTRRRRPRPNYKRSPSFGFSTCKWNWPNWPKNLEVGSAAPRSWGPRFFFRKSRPDRSGRYTCFGRDAPGLPIADGRIVNDPVEGAEPIHLLGHAASLGDAREITDDHGLRTRHGGERFLAPPLVASVCRTTLCPCSMRS